MTKAEPRASALVFYALPALPLAILTVPFYVIVPTYYNSIGLPIAAVGLALLLIRLADAVFDPVVGFLADATRTRLGRRKVWFAAGIPLTTAAAVMLFMPPDTLANTGYLLLWGMMLSLGWTIALVPYQAWGAELSASYEGRNRVTAYREGIAFIGTLLALVTPEAVKYGLGVANSAALAPTLRIFALFVGAALPATAILCLVIVREPLDRSVLRLTFRAGLEQMFQNKAFVRLVAAYLINGLANGLPATLFLLFVSEKLQLPEQSGLFLILYFSFGLAGVPVWLKVAQSTSKHRAWCYAMLMTCAAFILALGLRPGAFYGFVGICICTGLGVGADLALPASLQADVIDIDTARSGEQRSASYLAIWGLATKLALALAVGISFPTLAAFGLDPGAGLRSPEGLVALSLLYAGLPVLLKLCAIALMWRFPVNRQTQSALQLRIAAMRTQADNPPG